MNRSPRSGPALRQRRRDDVVPEPSGTLTVEAVMADPAASEALKTVVSAWVWRDVVDAAQDAEALHRLFAARADLLLEGSG